MARLGTAPCSPREIGVVEEFAIETVGPERAAEGAEAARDVTLTMRIRHLDGRTAAGTATATLHRVAGRWLVAAFTPPPALRTSPAASSAPPS